MNFQAVFSYEIGCHHYRRGTYTTYKFAENQYGGFCMAYGFETRANELYGSA